MSDIRPEDKLLAISAMHTKSCEINGSKGCEHGDACPVLVCAYCGDPWPCETMRIIEE